MTNEQFEALVKLMRGDLETFGNQAARLVLVDGLSQADAMRKTGASRASTNNAVRRYKDSDALMRRVYGATL